MLRFFAAFLASVVFASLAADASAAPTTPIVFTKTAALTDLSETLTYPARIESKVNARILAESDGVVLRILAPLGHRVARGGAIVVIKNIESGYRYAPLTVRSAVGGVVSQVKVTIGSQVTRGQELATVTDPDQLRLTIEVAAPDVANLTAGLKGEFTVAGVEKPVPVRLIGISPFVDPATGTASAELAIDRPATSKKSPQPGTVAMVPGQLGQVRFDVNRRQGYVLPDHAVVYKGSDTFVRLVIDGKAKQQAVKLGTKRRGQVEILEGLKVGDRVVERSSGYVGDGADVQVQSSDSKVN